MKYSMIEARDIAEIELKKIEEDCRQSLKIITEKTIRTEYGWIFFYEAKKFLETGRFVDRLAGNGPLFIEDSGEIHRIPSSIKWSEYIETL